VAKQAREGERGMRGKQSSGTDIAGGAVVRNKAA